MKLALAALLVSLLMEWPAQAQVGLNVNQTHTLAWQWESAGSPVREFVFRCGTETKQITDADARSLRFGSLVDTPGTYTGCTLSARNEAGLSAPVVLPDFTYTYSYGTLGWLLLECVASACALAGLVSMTARRVAQHYRRKTAPLLLAPPIIILEKEREHVYGHY